MDNKINMNETEIIGDKVLTWAWFRSAENEDNNDKLRDLGIPVKEDDESIEEELIPFTFKLDHLTAYNPSSNKDRTIIRLLNGENFLINANFEDFDDLMAAIEIEKDWKSPTLWQKFVWWMEDKFKNKGKI